MKPTDPVIRAIDALIDEIGSLRIEALRIKRLVLERISLQFDEKTPVRPPSQSAMQAFQTSQEFLSGRKPPPKDPR